MNGYLYFMPNFPRRREKKNFFCICSLSVSLLFSSFSLSLLLLFFICVRVLSV